MPDAPHEPETPTGPDSGLGPGQPTPPIEIEGGAARATARLSAPQVPVPDALLDTLAAICPISVDDEVLSESSRDWWPLAMTWALEGQVAARGGVVVSPSEPEQVAEILARCNEAQVPVTAAAGRSGVVGGSVPVHGGVVLDLCGLTGIRSVDSTSLVVDVLPGTFGDHFEDALQRDHGLTVGHWPQSMALSTVGGWIACRGAGQLSNRYGKIEDLVVGLDVALADGRIIHTGGNARAAVGPDLNQVFVGSEGTLGIIVGARLRARPVPTHHRQHAVGFASFEEGLEACRRIARRGAQPAVVRLYDAIEGERNFGTGDIAPLLIRDEGDPALVDATMEVVEEECQVSLPLDAALVDTWMAHRNNVDALEALIRIGAVVDTMEITGPWGALPQIYQETLAAIGSVPGVLAVSAHQSHAYVDGACLYFTFGGKPEGDDAAAKDAFYRQVWDTGTRSVLHHGGSLSHHHGVGINRARFTRDALGGGLDVLALVKAALDPNGILNPGKLGLPDPLRRLTFRDRLVSAQGQVRLQAAAWGMFSSAVFSVPIAIVVGVFDRDGSNGGGVVTVLKLVLLLLSAAFAGFAAGRTAGSGYTVNGALAGAATFLLVQITYSIARGSFSNPLALVYAIFLGACLGTLGGLFASRQTERRQARDQDRRPERSDIEENEQ